ncbi:MAG: 2-phospho-L-lactate guanylyltransferase [Planctomycetes bacterium]|nr:2-phospho-L-lactate guanylyltransferase [Chloroflexota bacterium]MBM4027600.1 2-phospho-L-lactate guanylyltransferase [Planctomycetota bacterium]
MSGSGIRIVVPIKPLAAGKSRLSPVLDRDRRVLLSLAMFIHVLRVARETAATSQVAVLGGDPTVARVAQRLNVLWEPEPARGLNRCLKRAFQAGVRLGWDATLFVPADLPELASDDLACVLEMAHSAERLVVAPDRFDEGTNALLVPSLTPFPPRLGPHSFTRHLTQARRLGIPTQVCRREGLRLDIDTPADLALLLARRPAWWQEAEEVCDVVLQTPLSTLVSDLETASRRARG